ncbi:hypothetical protein BJX65DRAFT_309486 [Aspergillus insuetus]
MPDGFLFSVLPRISLSLADSWFSPSYPIHLPKDFRDGEVYWSLGVTVTWGPGGRIQHCMDEQTLDREENTWRTTVRQPLVRRSMVRLLASKYEFSKTFCDSIDPVSFETLECSPARSTEKELMLVTGLVSGVLELIDGVFAYSTASESNSDDSEDPNYRRRHFVPDDDDDD